MMTIADLRKQYHAAICRDVLRVNNGSPNFADANSNASRKIALSIVEQFAYPTISASLPGQTAGNRFEAITRAFLENLRASPGS
jgi:hypothetical protein